MSEARVPERAAMLARRYNPRMVAVLHAAPQAAAPQAVAAWLDSLVPVYGAEARAQLAGAIDYARERCGDATLPDGEAMLARALGTASILAALRLDVDSLVAATLLGLAPVGALMPEPLIAAAIAVVDMDSVKPPAFGKLGQWRDVVPADRLRGGKLP